MKNGKSLMQEILRGLSYVLVAVLASCATFFMMPSGGNEKLAQIEALIGAYFIGDVTPEQLEDGAAAGMIAATGDRWSYYIPASEYADYLDQMNNAYVGVGITITAPEDAEGFLVQQVSPNGGAYEAGILPGDIIIRVEDQDAKQLGTDGAAILIKGEEGSSVSVTVLREGKELTFSVVRKLIQLEVAKYQMLPDNIGYITIVNFDERCAKETLEAVDALIEQGAQALIFDVRFNPGGYQKELVEILDYLLPEGTIFHAVDYSGEVDITKSDAECLKMPMAVLINDSSYSAAEFFAAALQEYEWATIVGEPTIGKSYMQSTFELSDGSAVGISIGKYCTPNGVSLAEVGGLKPDVEVVVDDETYAAIYAGTLEPENDPQLQAAIAAVKAAS